MNFLERTQLLLGKEAIGRLSKVKVAIFGVGGVGSFAAEALVRSGIVNLMILDFDQVKESNLNRQLFALSSTIGKLKVDAAAERLLAINPAAHIQKEPVFVSADNAAHYLSKVDIAIDAIDSVNPKTDLLEAAVRENVPIISSMGAGGKSNPYQMAVDNIFETKVCALARVIRRRLRSRGITTPIRCVYSLEPKRENAYLVDPEYDQYRKGRRRMPIGSICHMPAIFGLTIASEVLNYLINKDE